MLSLKWKFCQTYSWKHLIVSHRCIDFHCLPNKQEHFNKSHMNLDSFTFSKKCSKSLKCLILTTEICILTKKRSVHLEPHSLSTAIEMLKQKTVNAVEDCSASIKRAQKKSTILSTSNCSKTHTHTHKILHLLFHCTIFHD